MHKSLWTTDQLEGFHLAAESLKLFRRAELEDTENSAPLIRKLYVDPLPEEHIFNTVMKPSTTFIIGRKGTGKSTIFQRVQNELRGRDSAASAYVDIKTVYESSGIDSATLGRIEQIPTTLSKQRLEQLLLYRSFIEATFSAIKEDLKARLKESLRARIKNFVSGSIEELFESLDGLLEEARSDRFISVMGVREVTSSTTTRSKDIARSNVGLDATLAANPNVKASVGESTQSELSNDDEKSFADVLIRAFNIKEILLHLKKLLTAVSIKHLYIFVDDFSELPEDAMRIVVDTILAPLNNWSDELIKFKVAAYPGRVYYGQIDKTKIDEIYLDLYNLYGASDVSGMEEKAIDFTRRLVTTRLLHFTGKSAETFFDTVDNELWRLMFYATMANPRNLGHILFYLHESSLIYGKLIGRKAIRDAAQRYYEDKIEPYFAMTRFLHETFAERASIYSLKGLLEDIVQRAKELKKYRDSTVMKEIRGNPPTSHFYVVPELEALLQTLELNFYVTKYYEMNDRDGHRVSVFALNFGLCQKYAIEYGRPMEKREHRLYFVERIFDYSSLLRKFIQNNQEIRCASCNATIPLDKLDALKFYDMACPNCREGVCRVINLSKKYEAVLAGISPELLLPSTELGILQTLKTEHRWMFASEIASELDRSYQLVGKRGKMLAQRGLVKRDENKEGRRTFEITGLATESYFSDPQIVGLEVPLEPVDP